MKSTHLFFILIAVLLFSCGQQNEGNSYPEFSYGSNDNFSENNIQQKRKSNNQNIKYHTLMDPQYGIPLGALPIPKTWKESNNTKEKLLFEGPNGLKVTEAISNHSAHNAPIKSIDRFIIEDLKPLANAEGFHFVRQYPIPQIAQFDQQLDSYLFKATPEQKQYQCIATEWENTTGASSIVIVRYYVSHYQIGGSSWGITLNCLETSNNSFEEEKNSFINSLLHFQINPQWVQVNNQYWSQKTQIATAAHQQKMADIESFGRINTAAHNARMAASDAQFNSWRANQAASDAQYSSWRSGQASSDAGQVNYVDGIWEQRNMTNPNTGENYKIEGYDNNVWLNQNNEYISTDNSLYNPNLYNNTNNQNWTQLEDNNNY